MIPDVHNETTSVFFSAVIHSFVPYNAFNFALAIVCGLPRVDLSEANISINLLSSNP
jgi:hypothetical protein